MESVYTLLVHIIFLVTNIALACLSRSLPLLQRSRLALAYGQIKALAEESMTQAFFLKAPGQPFFGGMKSHLSLSVDLDISMQIVDSTVQSYFEIAFILHRKHRTATYS